MKALIALFWVMAGLMVLAPAAHAAPLVMEKSSLIMSDPLNGIVAPKAIPEAVVDYTIKVNNPNTIWNPVNSVSITDKVPANTKMYVGALGTLSLNSLNLVTTSPVAIYDDNLLGLGLLFGSGLSFSFTSLGNDSDSIAFSNDNGQTYAYTPVPDASGYDANVTHFKVTFNTQFKAGTNFSLRYRVMIK